jgi:hypothetical protein
VPRSEKSAVFCEIGKSWPSHHAHPLGAKLNGNMRISATNGSATNFLLCVIACRFLVADFRQLATSF